MYDSIVKIQGGLGNQMFQYSVAKWLELKGNNVALDISHYSKKFDGPVDPIHNGYELENIFGLSANYADYFEVCKVADIKRDYFSRARRKFLFLKSTHIQQERICKDELYVPDLISKSPAYIDGYWCTFKYAECIESTIRKCFVFKNTFEGKNKGIEEIIRNTNSVSIHVRHGDYLKTNGYFHIPSLQYYKNSMEIIKNNVKSPVFFCFSDDIEWCKKTFADKNIYYIDWNTSKDSFKDMELMSLCKHNVTANSTFSMWGAWLNKNCRKIVIHPAKTYGDVKNEMRDTWPETWISIDG